MSTDESPEDYRNAIELQYLGEGSDEYEDPPVDVNHRRARRERNENDRNQNNPPEDPQAEPPSRWTSFFQALGWRLPRCLAEVNRCFICFIISFILMSLIMTWLFTHFRENVFNTGVAFLLNLVRVVKGPKVKAQAMYVISYVTSDDDSVTAILKKVPIK